MTSPVESPASTRAERRELPHPRRRAAIQSNVIEPPQHWEVREGHGLTLTLRTVYADIMLLKDDIGWSQTAADARTALVHRPVLRWFLHHWESSLYSLTLWQQQHVNTTQQHEENKPTLPQTSRTLLLTCQDQLHSSGTCVLD